MEATEPIDFDVEPRGGVEAWVAAHSRLLAAFPHGSEPPPGIAMSEMNQLREHERDTLLRSLRENTTRLSVAMEAATLIGADDEEIEALVADWPLTADGRTDGEGEAR